MLPLPQLFMSSHVAVLMQLFTDGVPPHSGEHAETGADGSEGALFAEL